MKLFLLITYLFISSNSFAQSLPAIEADLLKSFEKINKSNPDIDEANRIFVRKLKYYVEKYPSTLNQNFKLLKSENLGISNSTDGLIRIYSWDTQLGGTMHIYNDLMEYKISGKNYITSLRDTSNEEDNGSNFGEIYTLKANGNIYYLARYSSVYDFHHWGYGIITFSIENGNLNKKAEIIKTEDGLSNSIGWYCNENSIDSQSDINFRYDESTKKIYLPIISGNGEKYNDYLIYKFNGQYFERVKN